MSWVAIERINPFRILVWCAIVLLAGAVPARAQMAVGDDLTVKMNGTLGYGYSSGWGDQQGSSHTNSLIGDGNLNGSYYNPNFINFQVRPFWDRTQNNNGIQLINRQSGIESSVGFFTGSFFPGFATFSKQYNSNGQTGLGSAASLRTSGSDRSFGIGWSELIPGLPPVFANFSMGAGSYEALGENSTNENRQKNFNTGTNYQLAGWNLSANYNYGTWGFDYADLAGLSSTGSGSSSGVSVGAGHSLPLHGQLGLSWGHNSHHSDGGTTLDGSSTTESASVSMAPISKVSVGAQIQHTSNLSAALSQLLLSGGESSAFKSDDESSSLSMSGSVSWSIARGLSASGFVTESSVRLQQRYIKAAQYGGSVNYHFQRGFLQWFRFGVGLSDSATKQGNRGMAIVGNVNMDHRFHGWDVSGDYGYSQDVQTLYGISATSQHYYGGSVRRRLNETTFWSGSFRGSHNGLTGQAGSGAHTESLSSNISLGRYSAGGSYTRGYGQSVITASGLSNPITGIELLTDDFVYTNGRSFSVAGSARLFHSISMTGAMSKSHSTLQSPIADTFSSNKTYIGQLDWRLRKMSFSAGYSRSMQNATNMTTPFLANSIYVHFSRWFNVF